MTNFLKKSAFGAFFAVFIALTAGHALAFGKARVVIHHGKKQHFFAVEVAKTKEELRQGLMSRAHLSADRGMLFLTESPRIMHMWMKNTLIPLDMLFVDSAGTIVYIAERAEPESTRIISYDSPVAAVLEIAGGQVDSRGIVVGDVVNYTLDAQ